MDVFSFHRSVVEDYASYVGSFIGIRDARIREEVDESLAGGRLWPDPLVQFNPAYEEAASVADLCARGVLHGDMADVFAGFRLYEHQVAGIGLGTRGENFVVTSGTGSGKSLTYLGTIFDHVLRHRPKRGVHAVLVYPMNALINSQWQEIDKYRRKYEERTGDTFPIRFEQYTGQENDAHRQRVMEEEPHIILSNYMMMELIMTRRREERLRASMKQHLRFLVYDELHTYRGRQGADVGMLNRRIQEFVDHPLVCIGTSATMASGRGAYADQQAQVAEVAQRVFGQRFAPDQVIGETLTTQFVAPAGPLGRALERAVQEPIDEQGAEEALLRHPLAYWLEREVGLEEREGRLVRRKPLTLPEIRDRLAAASGVDAALCEEALRSLLRWVVHVNLQREARNRATNGREKPLLPFKLHQFIAQTGSVYVTLGPRETRAITLDAGYYVKGAEGGGELPIYPVAFSRRSGHDFICVRRSESEGRLHPREFFDLPRGDDEDDEETGLAGSGYLLLDVDDEPVWDEAVDLENLPDSWLNRNKEGVITSVKGAYRDKIPQRIYFAPDGSFADAPSAFHPHAGWFIPAKLPLDPTTGQVYDARTSEYAKLAKLGSEARSTSTSVIARSVVRQLRDAGADAEAAKLLSFTDNRQDASLQAGHFNDFNQVVQLRSAIVHAVEAAGGVLEASALARAVFDELGLPEEVYAINAVTLDAPFRPPVSDNEEALKTMLFYRAVYDLRRSWRVILPNLEECALLRIRYKHVGHYAAQDAAWRAFPGFDAMDPRERARLLTLILDYFRTGYALDHPDLQRGAIEDNAQRIRARLKAPWGLDQGERLSEPYYMRVRPFESRRGLRTSSVGYLSQFGRYLRGHPALAPHLSTKADYEAYVERLLGAFVGTYLSAQPVASAGGAVTLYRLLVDAVEWTRGDGETVFQDVVRLQGYKKLPPPRVNAYFQRVYQEAPGGENTLHGAEHTGQIANDLRQKREGKFRHGEIQALFCSPTMELGIDIADLSVVHMRNAPPNPANYAQRSGRAGRSGQAALAITYCANGSAHDRHYFEHSRDMVAGVVVPPRIDLANRELLLSHLHAVYLAEVGLAALDGEGGGGSIAALVDLTCPPELPLQDAVQEALQLPPERAARVRRRFRDVLARLGVDVNGSWYGDGEGWLDRAVADALRAFDRALNRWRDLYLAAIEQRAVAQRRRDDPALKLSHDERREAEREERQARRQIDLLLNEARGSRYHSEFYPYRYLAAEGFLPGYNFTRLPVRAFVPHGDDGEYISRPRAIALREFGPRNRIYHNGAKFEVNRQQVLDVESRIERAKVSLESGYFLRGPDYNLTNCPVTGLPIKPDGGRGLYPRLLELGEVQTYSREHITCEEEERSRIGYDIRTYFAFDGPPEDVVTLDLQRDGETLLTLKYVPTARIYYVNNGWSFYKDEGFLIETKTGLWRKSPTAMPSPAEAADTPVMNVKLFTSDVADALYLHPSEALGLEREGVITLQYALEKAVGQVFQVEQGEVQSTLMGEEGVPNVLIYEAAEGSLGVLSQAVEDPARFRAVAEAAYALCYFDDPDKDAAMPKASYDDLLSYYNQRHHGELDRHLIRGALELLMACEPVVRPRSGLSYEEQYESLLHQADPNSTLETVFLEELYTRRLRLPDRAQWRAPNLYVQPDFFYEPNVAVFVDGSVHDAQNVRQRDGELRRRLRADGYRPVVWDYKEPFDAVLAQAPDVFTPIS